MFKKVFSIKGYQVIIFQLLRANQKKLIPQERRKKQLFRDGDCHRMTARSLNIMINEWIVIK